MPHSLARRAENEALFRSVNERIESLAGPLYSESLTIVCECADATCVQQLRVPWNVYEQVRSDPHLFLVAPGHEIRDLERVVERTAGYAIVRKREGQPAAVAERTDPRS